MIQLYEKKNDAMEILRRLIGSAIGCDAQLISGGVLHTCETVAKFLNHRFKSWTGSHANRYTARYHGRSMATPGGRASAAVIVAGVISEAGGRRKDDRFAALHPAFNDGIVLQKI